MEYHAVPQQLRSGLRAGAIGLSAIIGWLDASVSAPVKTPWGNQARAAKVGGEVMALVW